MHDRGILGAKGFLLFRVDQVGLEQALRDQGGNDRGQDHDCQKLRVLRA